QGELTMRAAVLEREDRAALGPGQRDRLAAEAHGERLVASELARLGQRIPVVRIAADAPEVGLATLRVCSVRQRLSPLLAQWRLDAPSDAPSRRAVRKWKKSLPSPSRRRRSLGLRSVSQVIANSLRGRK